MPIPPRPTAHPRVHPDPWGEWLTRVLFAFYLTSNGSPDWLSREDELRDGVAATGWLDEPAYPDLEGEVITDLLLRWRVGAVYRLDRAFVRYMRNRHVAAQRMTVGPHPAVGLHPEFAQPAGAGEVCAAQDAPDPMPGADRFTRVRAAVGATYAELQAQAADPLPVVARVGARRVLLYRLYYEAAVGTSDRALQGPLNTALQVAGCPTVEYGALNADMRDIRPRQFGHLFARLDPADANLAFLGQVPAGQTLERARQTALDELVRSAMRGQPPTAPAAPAATTPVAAGGHLLNRWHAAWPTGARRARWDATFAWYNPTGHLPGGVIDHPPDAEPEPVRDTRFAVLDEMSLHLEEWRASGGC